MEADHGIESLVRVPIPGRGDLDLRSGFILARAVRTFQIDVLHAHTSHALSYALMARALARRAKVVASRRVDFMPSRNPLSWLKYRRADRIIAISNRIGEVMRSFGLPESKLGVVHSGIDPRRFDVPRLHRDLLKVPEGVPLIGNVAALVGHKDHATLIEAMALVLKDVPEAHLVIAGEGPLRTELEAHIERLGIGHAVHLLGFRDDVPRILRTLDLFVLSSKEEGLGTSILDAMICEVPVVATAGGGIPEMVQDGVTGLLAPPQSPSELAAAIVRTLHGPHDAKGRATNALAHVLASFTVDRMVDGNIRAYESLLDHKKTTGERD
jgi:glycosyltransferase involved in cell wall biosynthesis